MPHCSPFSLNSLHDKLTHRNESSNGGLQLRRRGLSLVRALIISAAVIYLAQPLVAQNVQKNNEAVDIGLRSNVIVNPATRAIELQIPLGNYPGRAGHDVPVTLSYSSKLWNMKYQGFASGPPPGYPGPQPFTILMAKYGEHSTSGWNTSTGGPFIDPSPGNQLYDQFGNARDTGNCSAGCFVIDRVMVWMPDGSGHELRSSDQAISYTAPRPDNLYAVDGSRIRYQRSTSTLYMPDGSRYVSTNPGGHIDRNGNTIDATDTLGRTIGNPPLASLPGDYNYSLPGVGGGTINYTFKWRYLADVLTTSQPLAYVANSGCPPGQGSYSPYLFTSDINSRTCIQNAMQQFNPVVLWQIVLPTGFAYTFTYNTYGEIDKVVLPTGGYERYVYSYIVPLSYSSYVYGQYNRGVSSRIVSSTGLSTDEVTWSYSGGGFYVKMTAPDGTWTERYTWGDGNSMWGYSSDGARAGRAYEERTYAASGQMLRRKLTEWAMTGSNGTANPPYLNYANRNARVTRETEFILDTGGGALARTTTYDYDLTYQFDVGIDQTSIKQFDYVLVDQNTAQTLPITSLSSIPTGTLLRTTQTAYLTSDANYRNRNIVGLPTSVTVYKGAPVDNVILAQTSTAYDEASYPLLPSGSPTGWTDPQTVYRANATTVGRWLNTTGTYIQSHVQYDKFGNVRNLWDANGNQSQIDYDSAYQYAYPTSTTTAVPDPNGTYGSSAALVSTSVYDLNTGRVTSSTDANVKTTTFDYTDPLNRIKLVTRPDGGTTSYIYEVYNGKFYVETLTKQDAGTSIDSYQFVDGLGRPNRSFLKVAAGTYITSDTQYDTMGRPYRVSSPYLSSGSDYAINPSGRWNTSVFDALGRVVSVTTPDAAQVVTEYGASTGATLAMSVTVTDQAQKKRRSLTDALGRLVRVDEPTANGLGDINSPNQPTVYTYDLLGNLKRVDQGQQHRYFLYDSLSRLIRAWNPEQLTNSALALTDPLADPLYPNSQWSMGYAYDGNGNLITKVDARNVTTNYQYDALNRNRVVTYTNDPAGTPAISRYYDGWRDGSYNANGNRKGRLWQTEASGALGSRVTVDSYDAMGRPLQQSQEFKVGSGWSAAYVTSCLYDFAGHVISGTYPSGHFLTYNYDIAGRLADKDTQNLAFTGNLGDGVTRTYASGVGYDEAGRMTEEKYGTTTPLYHKQHFNVRGQLYDIRLSTVPWQTDEWDWNRGAVLNYYEGSYTPRNPNSGPDNNGNLLRAEVYIPNDNWTRQNFSYDSLNRLTSVTELLNGASTSFMQAYDYDLWGNRSINAGSWGTGINTVQTSVDSNTNRMYAPNDPSHSVIDYDAAGNQTKDYLTWNGTRAYDAENRMITASNGVTDTYTYDADGKRTRRKVGKLDTWYVYGLGGELVAEYAPNAPANTPDKEYGYRNGELLVTAAPVDAVLGKTVTQKSTFVNAGYTFSANLAIDANTNGTFWDISSATTNYDYQNWWQVDLGNSQSLSSIQVWPRTDCCSEHTANFYVIVSDNAFISTDLTTTLNQPGVSSYWVAGNNATVATVAVNRTARYVRVQRNDSQYLVLAEVKVWQTTADVEWLVTDQLGTPRMIADATGSLAGIKRHDYLPFGEELMAGQGGRTAPQGYTADNIRQKFTRKERDSETGLDFFEARYYSSTQGRFTSPDEFNGGPVELFAEMASANPTFYADLRKPQSLNKYQYAHNNPLRYIDPDGHEPDGEQDDVVKINSNPPVIQSVSVRVIDKLPNGSVPVGGEFEITYKYRTSIPQDGVKPEDLGRIEAIDYEPTKQNPAGGVPKGGGSFAGANNLGTVGDPKVKVDVGKESVTVEKTERFVVKPRPDSKPGASGAINYKIVVTNPRTGQTTNKSSKGPDTLFKQPLPYIPVQNVPKPPPKKKNNE